MAAIIEYSSHLRGWETIFQADVNLKLTADTAPPEWEHDKAKSVVRLAL